MNCSALYFTAPRHVEVQENALPDPGQGQVLVQSRASAISAGTELLVYRGEFPADLPLDASLDALSGAFAYPLRYGYALVGEVVALGAGVDAGWRGRQVFAFQPHASRFCVPVGSLLPIPDSLPVEAALFLPNMETAINLVHDGAPMAGEQVALLGQGVVGLLATALLAKFPLASLVTLDRYPLRRQTSLQMGASASLDPDQSGGLEQTQRSLQGTRRYPGADLVYELSGTPAALDLAISLCGFSGRVVIGSWYGTKRAPVDLGGRFHRERMRLISSQVSTLAPELSGRWDKSRRFDLAWNLLREINPDRLITHRFNLEHAAEAYLLLDQQPDEAIQVIIEYG